MLKTYSENFKLRYSEVDKNGKIKAPVWFDLMQEVAAAHAENLGFGYKTMLSQKIFWVLSRLKIKIVDNATRGDTLTVTTWPGQFRRLFALRHFNFTDQNQRIIATASSQWMIISLESGRPQNVNKFQDLMPDNSDLPSFFDLSNRIPAIEASETPQIVPIRYSLEDLNQHLNNSKYIEFIQDCIDDINKSSTEVNDIDITFHAEMKAPDKIYLYSQNPVSGEYFISGRKSTGELSFTSHVFSNSRGF